MSPKTGRLEECMAPDNLDETTHRPWARGGFRVDLGPAGRETHRGAEPRHRRDHDLSGIRRHVPDGPHAARRIRHTPGPRPVNGRFGHGCRVAAVLLTAVACQSGPARAAITRPHDVTRPSGVVTWGASADRMGEGAADQGYRMIVHTSVAGSAPRVRFTNAFGDRPLTLDSVHAGLRGAGAALRPGSNHRLTFRGARRLRVP
ncbi:hypothetical protein ACWEN3_35810, partial [Streptomyces sp. NPDC004561]